MRPCGHPIERIGKREIIDALVIDARRCTREGQLRVTQGDVVQKDVTLSQAESPKRVRRRQVRCDRRGSRVARPHGPA